MERKRFKTSFAENIFRAKYAQGPSDTWDALVDRLVEDVCGTRWGTKQALMSDTDRKDLSNVIKEMKFVPGGRYLYYAGREYKAFNNCFSGDTKLLTSEGWVRFDSVVGKEINVLSPEVGLHLPAVMHSHGLQDVYEYVFIPVRGKSKIEYRVKATENHRWYLVNGTWTEDLKVGDVVPANGKDYCLKTEGEGRGFCHGFVFGDGNRHGQLRLCAPKDVAYLDDLSSYGTVTYPEFAGGDPVLYFGWLRNIGKQLPDKDASMEYIRGFIRGWLAADGSGDRLLCSVNKDALLWFREYAAYAGLVITGDLRKQTRDVTLGKYEYLEHDIWIQNFCRGGAWAGFKVLDKKFAGHQEVFCPFEPEHNKIVIDHNMVTGNCYLLRAEEDTREEWSNVTWRAMSCLMTGGGIGIDYSRLRPSGTVLKRTGGKASGPIPLMFAINEIGRNVMQGGSRRSAIYASLNHAHEDIPDYLGAKDWHNHPVGQTGATAWDVKQQDFNFPAALDMTNISINYDDNAGNLLENQVFLQNCAQAMKTGEPGFSFNFGEKINETLRNACTEVTSEDDSDVCNLGSINLGNIDSLEEFKSIVSIASKFLICGTLRADLPYEKVYKVREKNRRLGLGVMGFHEWLLKRGQKYEVTTELRQWLTVYRDESERAAKEHCDRFFLSHPVAFRAIAPTGTIGILAGTTTGIEPLFAVAYKRRFLTDGTKWKYQFVVDSTADLLIREYGVDPNKIDTAVGLSTDFERRIKFQADVQDYVDMSISSTINLPAWGTKENNLDKVQTFATVLDKYARRLRGFTCYPDGSRGGQPITQIPYEEALKHEGIVYEENDICDISGKGGSCGV